MSLGQSRWVIRPEKNATSRETRSSFATVTLARIPEHIITKIDDMLPWRHRP